MSLAKDEAKRIIENLSDEATWDDIMYQLYVKEKVEKSLDEVEQGKLVSHDEVKKRSLNIKQGFLCCLKKQHPIGCIFECSR